MKVKEKFFSRDKTFYRVFRQMIILVVMNNLITYSVNMIDNIMLGSYSQSTLSGASIVNQLFFLIQQLALSLGNGLVILTSQYWGEKKTGPIRTLTGSLIQFTVVCSFVIVGLLILFPHPILGLFSSSEPIIEEGMAYLSIVLWSYPLFMVSMIFAAVLRSVNSPQTSFITAVISLIINAVLNYLLIFGNLGFPEMGIKGAAIATVIARIFELAFYIFYLARIDQKIHLFSRFLGKDGFFNRDKALRKRLVQVTVPVVSGTMLWSLSVPVQTAIMGHISDDAIAANAVASTFYQYLKVVVTGLSNVSSTLIGNAIGASKSNAPKGRPATYEQVRAEGRTLSCIDLLAGFVLGLLLFVLRHPLLSLYQLSDTAMLLADHMLIILSIVMVGMSYEMPVNNGILQGGGDIRFAMILNLISVWVIVMPLSFLAAFVWKLPVEAIVLIIQSDQIFKCLPIFLRFRSYRWIRNLT